MKNSLQDQLFLSSIQLSMIPISVIQIRNHFLLQVSIFQVSSFVTFFNYTFTKKKIANIIATFLKVGKVSIL